MHNRRVKEVWKKSQTLADELCDWFYTKKVSPSVAMSAMITVMGVTIAHMEETREGTVLIAESAAKAIRAIALWKHDANL